MPDQSEEPLLLLKFEGQSLDLRSVPIYELGDTLMALQRIVHKSFLFDKERLRKNAQLRRDERARLSLQISDRTKSSDVYALVPFVTDPLVRQYITSLLKLGLSSLGKYAAQKVLSSLTDAPSDSKAPIPSTTESSALIGAIYAEAVQITNHINNIGEVEKIEIVPHPSVQVAPIAVTKETQGYVRRIAYESYRGPKGEIIGSVTRLDPSRHSAEIRVRAGQYVKVRMNSESFNFVRYETGQYEKLRFVGHPVFKVAKDLAALGEFEADAVFRVADDNLDHEE